MLPAEVRLSPSIGGSLERRVERSAKSGESKMEDAPEPEPDEWEEDEGEGVDEIRASGAELGTLRRGNVSFISVDPGALSSANDDEKGRCEYLLRGVSQRRPRTCACRCQRTWDEATVATIRIRIVRATNRVTLMTGGASERAKCARPAARSHSMMNTTLARRTAV